MHANIVLLQEYRRAIALNNIAVELIECGAFQQAAATLENCLLALRDVTLLQDIRLDKSPTPYIWNVEDGLSRTDRCMAKVKSNPPPVPLRSLCYERNRADSLLISMLKCTLSPPSDAYLILRMDCSTLDDCPSANDSASLDLDIAIVMYNLGIAFLCISRSKIVLGQSAVHEDSEGKHASQLLQNAFALLARMHGFFDSMDDVQVGNVLSVIALVLQGILELLGQACTEEGQIAKECLLDTMQALGELKIKNLTAALAAAA